MDFIKKTGFALIALLAMSLGASAQERTFKFTLTRDVRVGKTSLPAGNYRLALSDGPAMFAVVAPESGNGRSALALPISSDYASSCKSNSLTFVPDGQGLSLASVCFADSDFAVYFPSFGKREAATQITDTAALAGAQ